MPTFNCKQCNKLFTARQADRDRGWAIYCSKSCKAKKQYTNTKGAYELRTKEEYESYLQDAWYINDDIDDDENYGNIICRH